MGNLLEIDNLISLLSRLPGIGPRSARRMALNLLKQPESLMKPLADSLILTAKIKTYLLRILLRDFLKIKIFQIIY